MKIDSQILFKSGQLDYHTFRIPSLISLPNDIIIAFAEGRKNNSKDHGDIQIIMRKSNDGGITWHSPSILLNYKAKLSFKMPNMDKFVTISEYEEITCGNPCPVFDKITNRLFLSYNLDNKSMWIIHSDDFGETWSKPRNITIEAFGDDHKFWRHMAAGPGHGIQTNTGRLTLPCDHQLIDRSGAYFSMLVISDDHGKTWEMGEVSDLHLNECEVCQLKDGKIYWNMRSYRGNNCRVVSYSENNGDDFEEFLDDPELIEPVCQASVLRYDYKEYKDKNIVLFSNPASKNRDHMTIKISEDGARTWKRSILLYEGPSAYSDLCYNQNGEVCILYERGEQNPYESIVFSRLKLF